MPTARRGSCVRAGCPPPSSPAIRSSCGRSLALRRRVACICDSMPLTSGGRRTGHWWVLGDRTQAPSGAGYALENRLALSRAMPDVYRELRVERLAPFFQAVQAELSGLNRQDDSRVCVLTPGPLNETYFEHAYLARYLGFLLVEGEDLTVRDDGVFIRTVSGLKRAEVLVRRLDADFADPLELNARSRLGVPGLVQAVRDGTVVIANALGSGVVEARAMSSFLPALAPAVLGSDLALPNVATWWLGQARARNEIIERLDEMVIASAFSGELPGYGERREVLGAALDPDERTRILDADFPSRHRFRRQGGRHPFDDADVAKRQARAATVHAAAVPGADHRRLAGHARRVRPGGRRCRRPRGELAAGRTHRRRLGAVGQAGRRDDVVARAGPDHDLAGDRSAAEPRRQQSVLGGSLRGTCRGDASAGPGARHPRRRQRRGRDAGGRADLCAARRLGGGADGAAQCQAGARRRGRIAEPRPRRCDALSGRGGEVGGIGDPRPLLARRVAGADRPVRVDQRADRSPGRPKARSSSASIARCASSRRFRDWRRKT